jgi:Ca2+-transporting ATPase
MMLMVSFSEKSVRAVLEELDTSEHGLSKIESDERFYHYGPNAIHVTQTPLWKRILEPLINVFMVVLFIAAIISFYHGDIVDAIIILAIIGVSAGIHYIQRYSTGRILRSLKKHTNQHVSTYRNNKLIEIDSTQLVIGDVFVLHEGEKIPADARIINAKSVRVDESMLTGESQPVQKQSDALIGKKQLYEQSNILFQGAFVISGEVTAVVIKTGNQTEFGQLAALSQDQEMSSPVQKKIDKLVTQIIVLVGAMSVVAFGLALLRNMELTESIKFVLALAVSAAPESLPVAISVVLVVAMRRMSARKALVRNMSAIESIGSITTIATDKTGTLTKNQLSVQETWQLPDSTLSIDSYIARSITHTNEQSNDPLDTAFLQHAKAANVSLKQSTLSFPFDQTVMMSGNMWSTGASTSLVLKGAPEKILHKSDLTTNEHEQAIKALHKLTAQGYRVIALASTSLSKPITTLSELPKANDLEFVGFVAVADVLRPEAKRAITAAQRAGVTVRMITGDHAETAYHIARQLGMASAREQVFDASHMSAMSDEELDHAIKNVRVFARVIPEHKFRILALLKKHHITAMTGDGVNDVPALANANVGIAMGSGSDIAKEAGDIVLLDDNFKSIIDAMAEGRVVVANIRRMLYYLLTTSAAGVLTMLGALIVGMPVPLLPVQILWINLVTDSVLVIPLGLEKGEKDVMKHPPKRPRSPILTKQMIIRMVIVAAVMAAVTLAIYSAYLQSMGESYARTIAFCALVVMQWSNAINARSDMESAVSRLRVWSTPFALGLTIAVVLQLLAIFGPLQSLLHLSTVYLGDLAIVCFVAFIIPLVVVELHKFIGRATSHKSRLQQ